MHIWNRPWPFIYEIHNRLTMLLSATFDEIATLVWNFYWAHKFVARWIRYSCVYLYLWPLRFVAVPVCGRSGLWPFRSVTVSVCGRFGLWPFRFWPFRFWPLWPESHALNSSNICKIVLYNPTVGCYNEWANLRCSGCSPIGENHWEMGILRHTHLSIVPQLPIYRYGFP